MAGGTVVKDRVFFLVLVIAASAVYAPLVWLLNFYIFNETQTVEEMVAGLLLAAFFIFSFSFCQKKLQKITSKKKYSAKMAEGMERAISDLQTTNKELERLDHAKTEFISVVSHQLRTPVALIKGVVSMLKEGSLKKLSVKEQNKFIDGLWQKSNKLEKIVKDILQVSELLAQNNAGAKIKGDKIGLSSFFNELETEYGPEAEARGTKIFFPKNIAYDLEIYGDRQSLKDAVACVIDNAIKYTPSLKETGETRAMRNSPGEILIEAKPEKDRCLIIVKDNGIGIPPEDANAVFKSFVRGRNANQAYTDGTGLGLYIAKEIFGAHGGKIWFESRQNEGTEFFISLPSLEK